MYVHGLSKCVKYRLSVPRLQARRFRPRRSGKTRDHRPSRRLVFGTPAPPRPPPGAWMSTDGNGADPCCVADPGCIPGVTENGGGRSGDAPYCMDPSATSKFNPFSNSSAPLPVADGSDPFSQSLIDTTYKPYCSVPDNSVDPTVSLFPQYCSVGDTRSSTLSTSTWGRAVNSGGTSSDGGCVPFASGDSSFLQSARRRSRTHRPMFPLPSAATCHSPRPQLLAPRVGHSLLRARCKHCLATPLLAVVVAVTYRTPRQTVGRNLRRFRITRVTCAARQCYRGDVGRGGLQVKFKAQVELAG